MAGDSRPVCVLDRKTFSAQFADCVDARIAGIEPTNGIHEEQMRWVDR